MYSVASRLLSEDWGDASRMAEDLGVLLLTWNQAFYRYGSFDYDRLEDTLRRHMSELKQLRERSISSFGQRDQPAVARLFKDFSIALRISDGKAKGRATPVGTAKALHLLAPRFFPLWDQYIAAAYGCRYSTDPATAYLRFIDLMKGLVAHALGYRPALPARDRSAILKRVDEYNYATFTMV